MATTYRKSKVEKFQKNLEKQLEVMEKSLVSLKTEGIHDGYKSLLTKYNMIFDILLDYCLEFDLELPIYPSERILYGHDEKENQARRDIMDKLTVLAKQEAFVQPNSKEMTEFAPLLKAIDSEEFFLQCNLNPTLKYSQAVYRACRKATMYFLYVVTNKIHGGKYKLSNVKVIDGFVGSTPHTWLQFGDDYYFDMTLAQFTSHPIPELAILPIEKTEDIYQVQHVIPWDDWVKLEASMI